jgi:tight adherence protein C
MNAALLAVFGAGIGLGIAVVLTVLIPARPLLADAIAAPHREIAPPRAKPDSLIQQIGAPARGALIALGLPRASVQADLRALDRPIDRHLAKQAGLALIGLLAGPVYTVALAAIGVRIPTVVLVGGTAMLTATGYLLPSRMAHGEANKLREQIRYATSALLDLASVMLAAGAGQEEAFTAAAAAAGTGPGHDRLRTALAAARTTRTPVWDEIAALGRRTGVPELTELAATSLLAGTEGAKIRDTLATKAASLRARLLAAAEAKAASATERMGLPTVLLMTGFLLFVCYPALAQVMKSL